MVQKPFMEKVKKGNRIVRGIKNDALAKNLKEARTAIRKKILTYIAAGFGVVIGFAWNDAISSLINRLFPDAASGIFAKFIYAIVLTAIVATVLFSIEKTLGEEKK